MGGCLGPTDLVPTSGMPLCDKPTNRGAGRVGVRDGSVNGGTSLRQAARVRDIPVDFIYPPLPRHEGHYGYGRSIGKTGDDLVGPRDLTDMIIAAGR